MSFSPSVTWSVSPFLLRVGGLNVRWFNVFWLCELVLGFWLLARQIRRGGGDDEEAADLAVYAWFGLILGARLSEGLFYNRGIVLNEPAWLLRFASGGISSHGAVLGTGLAVWLFARRRSLACLDVTDRLVFSFGAAAIVHRIASLFNSEIVGKPTDGSWGVRFPFFDAGLEEPPLRHPSQLYEALLGVLLLASSWALERHYGGEKRPRGLLTGAALSLYFAGRVLVELVKEPQAGEVFQGALNMGQLLSLPLLLAGLIVTWRSLRERETAAWRLLTEPAESAP